jgi:hypothetical protein
VGRYWFLRGRKEFAFLKWSQIVFGNAIENGTAVQYIKIIHHFDKGHQLSIMNTTARSNTDPAPRIYKNENDPLCPVKFFTFFRSMCCLEQERVFCKPYHAKQMKKWIRQQKPYQYNPNLCVGENNVGGINKDLARLCSLTEWERCTNHSYRKLGVTTAVSNADKGSQYLVSKACWHKDANTQKRYFKESMETMHSYNRAVLGKHVPSPTTSPRHEQKKICINNSPGTDTKPTTIVTIPGSECNEESSTLHDSVADTTLQQPPSQVIQQTNETYNNKHRTVPSLTHYYTTWNVQIHCNTT